jgi:uncharacterized small protein (DUF1192 family)
MSAFYSIVGLAAIFSGASTAIYLMGTTLEIGKVVTASYLHRNWEKINVLMRVYFASAVIVLMAITSMGTFGYLSKAHIEHTSGNQVSQMKIDRINRQIASEQKDIERAEASLNQMDAAVESMIERDYATSGLRARNSQKEERLILQNSIRESEKRIDELLDERAPYDAQIQSIELEVGPIRYVAEMIYGESNTELLEKSVRWMIIFLVLVFDPLAVMLILVATSKDTPRRRRQSPQDKYAADEKKWFQFVRSRMTRMNKDSPWKKNED